MPFQKIKSPHQDVQLAVWHITESEQDLLRQQQTASLKNSELEAIAKAEKRREWMASRLLVASIVEQNQLPYKGICKDEYNKPSLIGLSEEMSISHTKGLAAAALSNKARVGIDAEHISPRIAKIARKFLHEQEWERTNGNWQELLVYWCSKEALYKLYGKKGLIFKEQIRIERDKGMDLFVGHVITDSETIKAQLALQILDRHLIVSAIEQ